MRARCETGQRDVCLPCFRDTADACRCRMVLSGLGTLCVLLLLLLCPSSYGCMCRALLLLTFIVKGCLPFFFVSGVRPPLHKLTKHAAVSGF
jgi:hypothetical protein